MKTKILGIVNITLDSFSDGGNYLDPNKALAHSAQLLKDGADILDLGPASSHPDAAKIDETQERARLEPVLEGLKKTKAKISIDSFLSPTQLYGIKQEVDYLNDVSGFRDEAIYPQLAQAKCKLIIMHSIQAAKTRSGIASRNKAPKDIFSHVCNFFDNRLGALVKAGIDESRFIIDCGMGFFLGNQPQPSLEMLARLGELKQKYNLPLLVSVSRKSFLRSITNKNIGQIQPATLAAELFASLQGADYIRTHAPAPLKDGLKLYEALAS